MGKKFGGSKVYNKHKIITKYGAKLIYLLSERMLPKVQIRIHAPAWKFTRNLLHLEFVRKIIDSF